MHNDSDQHSDTSLVSPASQTDKPIHLAKKNKDVTQILLDLIRLTERYLTQAEVEKVERAFMFAAHAHRHVTRKSGEPYITHPMHVTCILADMRMDANTLCAGLLHDVVEDTHHSLDDLTNLFGSTVSSLVNGVTKLSSKEFRDKEQASLASFQKMMQFMVDDFRVVLIKLADRLHNVSTLGSMRLDKRRRIAKETLEIHVPLARRLGMNALRHQLQDYAFQHITHRRSEIIEQWWEQELKQTAKLRHTIVNNITDKLADCNISATVFEWDKNLYKLYIVEKNRRGKKDFNRKEITLDIRIIVNHDKDCYSVLGAIHQIYRPKTGAFRDFIAVPKSYGFQALQTHLITPSQRIVKVQIQSREMYQVAQYGITAQWRFPHLNRKNNIKISQQRLNNWLSDVSEIYQSTDNADEFMANMKAGFTHSEITVFTPTGDIKMLPPSSTPVDFAYAIHTQTGHTCIAAYIDGDPMPLNTQLMEGVSVEIITSQTATPHPSWLTFVKTGKARASIRRWLEHQNDDKIISLGEMLLRRSLADFGIALGEIDQAHFDLVLSDLNIASPEALYHALGKGHHSSKLVARRLLNNAGLQKDTHTTESPLLIKSTEGLAVHFQPCCNPIPKDTITAKLNPIRGLEVHRAECPRVRNRNTIETINLSWQEDLQHDFNACLLVKVRNKVGVLKTITDSLVSLGISIEDLNITGDSDVKENRLLIKVKSTLHLQQIIDKLKHERFILEVKRLFNIEVTPPS